MLVLSKNISVTATQLLSNLLSWLVLDWFSFSNAWKLTPRFLFTAGIAKKLRIVTRCAPDHMTSSPLPPRPGDSAPESDRRNGPPGGSVRRGCSNALSTEVSGAPRAVGHLSCPLTRTSPQGEPIRNRTVKNPTERGWERTVKEIISKRKTHMEIHNKRI